MMKKVGVEGINEGWSGGLLSRRGGGGIKFGLRISTGKKILDICRFSSLSTGFFVLCWTGKRYISRLWCIRLGYLWDENGDYLS